MPPAKETSSSASSTTTSLASSSVDLSDVGFVLLAGGTGSRMKANMPKQFLILRGIPVLHHSLDLFLNKLPAFAESTGHRYDHVLVFWMDYLSVLY